MQIFYLLELKIQITILFHPNSLFSGVYWVKTPVKSGNLMVYDPRAGTQMTMPNRKKGKLPPELWREVHYEPVAGRIVMFPAWMWHEVKPMKVMILEYLYLLIFYNDDV